MGWSDTIVGLNRLSDFLQDYVERDAAAKAAVLAHRDGFMLTYHRNMYIWALVDACHTGRKIKTADYERILSSLKRCAPSVAGRLRHSPAVLAIDALGASPLRMLVPYLWGIYNWLKFRSRKDAQAAVS